VGLGDAGFFAFRTWPANFSFSLQVVSASAMLRTSAPPAPGLMLQMPSFRGSPGVKLVVQLLLARGKILEGALEPVQKREHFIGSQMAAHNLCTSKLNETRPVRECVCECKSRVRNHANQHGAFSFCGKPKRYEPNPLVGRASPRARSPDANDGSRGRSPTTKLKTLVPPRTPASFIAATISNISPSVCRKPPCLVVGSSF